jgi:hypothetical protein
MGRLSVLHATTPNPLGSRLFATRQLLVSAVAHVLALSNH